jgi:hypothetical protein
MAGAASGARLPIAVWTPTDAGKNIVEKQIQRIQPENAVRLAIAAPHTAGVEPIAGAKRDGVRCQSNTHF